MTWPDVKVICGRVIPWVILVLCLITLGYLIMQPPTIYTQQDRELLNEIRRLQVEQNAIVTNNRRNIIALLDLTSDLLTEVSAVRSTSQEGLRDIRRTVDSIRTDRATVDNMDASELAAEIRRELDRIRAGDDPK